MMPSRVYLSQNSIFGECKHCRALPVGSIVVFVAIFEHVRVAEHQWHFLHGGHHIRAIHLFFITIFRSIQTPASNNPAPTSLPACHFAHSPKKQLLHRQTQPYFLARNSNRQTMSLVYNTISTIWKSAQYFCLLVLLTIAFDINRGCGLEYSFWLVLWYLPNTVLRRYSNHSTIKLLRTSLSISEPLVLVGLLAFTALRTSQAGYEPGLFKLWEYVISISDPLFSLCEGVGTILIIQRSSQIVRKLAQKSDGYQIGFLVLSASMYVMSGYGLYRLYAGSAPELVPSVLSASLIGCVMTLTLTLSIVTLISQRGVVTDTAGLFAYMTFAMYIASRIETFQHMERVKLEPANTTFATQPLPILQSMTVDEMNRMLVRAALYTMQLVDALFKTLAPSVLVGLLYRMVVVLTVSQIASGLTAGNSLEQVPRQRSSSNDGDKGDHDSDENSNSLIPSLASLAKPALLVTHSRILLQHFGYTYPTPALWNWLNAFLCLALYAAELVLARDDAWEQY